MAKVDEYCELGMATELAKYVAGATGGVAGLSGTFTLNGATNVVVANANLAVGDVVVWSLRTVGGTVGTHPAFVSMIGELVRERTGEAPRRAEGTRPACPDVCPATCCAYVPARPAGRPPVSPERQGN